MSASNYRARLLFVGLLFVLFMAPFDEGAGRDLLPLTAVTVTAVILGTVLLRRLLDPSSPTVAVRSPAVLPLILFLAVAAASVLWSIDRFVSLTGVARIFACTVVFLLVLHEFRSARQARILCTAVVILACALSGLGLWQASTRSGLFPTAVGARAHSVFVTPNTFAGFLIIAIPLTVSLAATAGRGLYRVALWLSAVFLFEALILSQSRGGWLAGAAGMRFLAWQLRRLKLLRLKVWPAAAVGLAAVVAVVSLSEGLRERLASVAQPYTAATFVERTWYWGSGLEMAAEGWPLGIGLDTYHIDYAAHQHASLAGTRQWFAHNDYLQILVELGPLGLLALSWLLWRVGRMARQVLGEAGDTADGALVAGCCAGAGAALLHSLVDFNLYVPATALLIFLCLAIIAAAHSRLAGAGRVVLAPGAAGLRRFFSTVVLAAGTAAAVFAGRPLAAQRLLQTTLFNAPLAVKICPLSANYWCYLGRMQEALAPEAAAGSYRRAVRLSPRTAKYHAYLGWLLHKSTERAPNCGEDNIGLDRLRRACALEKYSARWRGWLAEACREAGKLQEARRQLRFCLENCSPSEGLKRRINRALEPIEAR